MAVFVQTRQLHIPLLVSMLHCSLIRGLTYMYILNLQMKKVSSWDTGKVKVSEDIKTNKIPDSDEKKNRDLTISWIKNAYEFCFSRSFIPCIFTMVAYAGIWNYGSVLKFTKDPKPKPRMLLENGWSYHYPWLFLQHNYWSRNPQPSTQLASSCLTIQLSILKAGGEEVAGLLAVKGRMVRIVGFWFAAESHWYKLCLVGTRRTRGTYETDCCTEWSGRWKGGHKRVDEWGFIP